MSGVKRPRSAEEAALDMVRAAGAERAANYVPSFTATFSDKSLAVLKTACESIPKTAEVLMRVWNGIFEFLFVDLNRHWRVSMKPTRMHAQSSDILAIKNEAFKDSLANATQVTLTDADAHLVVETQTPGHKVVTHLNKLHHPDNTVPDAPSMENSYAVRMKPSDLSSIVKQAIGTDVTFYFNPQKELVIASKNESSSRDTTMVVHLADQVVPPPNRVTILKALLEPVEGLHKADSVNVLIHPDRIEFRGVYGDSMIVFLVASKITDEDSMY